MQNEILGNRLRERRRVSHLTQSELAIKSDVPQTTISQYERGVMQASAGPIGRLASALQCTADYLVGNVDDPAIKINENDLNDFEKRVIAKMRLKEYRDLSTLMMDKEIELKTGVLRGVEDSVDSAAAVQGDDKRETA